MPFVNTLWQRVDEQVERYGRSTQALWTMRVRDPWLTDQYEVGQRLLEVKRQITEGFGDKPRVAVVHLLQALAKQLLE